MGGRDVSRPYKLYTFFFYYLHQNMDMIGHYDMIENHFPVNDLPKNVSSAGRTDCHEINAFIVVVP